MYAECIRPDAGLELLPCHRCRDAGPKIVGRMPERESLRKLATVARTAIFVDGDWFIHGNQGNRYCGEAPTQSEKCRLVVNMHQMVLLFTLLSLIILPASAFADGSLVAKGRALAEANCARCHNLEKTGDSPFVPAPPFRIISKNYKPSDLEEALVEGIVVGHPAMPEFELTGEQAAALGAFIDSLGR